MIPLVFCCFYFFVVKVADCSLITEKPAVAPIGIETALKDIGATKFFRSNSEVSGPSSCRERPIKGWTVRHPYRERKRASFRVFILCKFMLQNVNYVKHAHTGSHSFKVLCELFAKPKEFPLCSLKLNKESELAVVNCKCISSLVVWILCWS